MARRDFPLFVIIYACVLHYIWALLLLTSPLAANATPVAVVVHVCGGRYPAAAVLFTIALLAQFAPLIRTPGWLPVLLLPQQVLLLMSAGAGIYATAVGHYADGVVRGWPFIAADQAPVTLIAFLYSAAVITYTQKTVGS